MSSRKAVTFSGKPSPASARRRSVHSESVARGRRRAAQSPRVERVAQLERREPRAVQDLVGVGVADAAEEARIGEGALERVALAREGLAELPRRVAPSDLEAAAIERCEPGLALHDVQRRPPLGARLGEHQRPRQPKSNAASPIRPGSGAPAGRRCRRPAIIRWMTRNSAPSSSRTMRLPSPPHADELPPEGRAQGRLGGAEEEGAAEADVLQGGPAKEAPPGARGTPRCRGARASAASLRYMTRPPSTSTVRPLK